MTAKTDTLLASGNTSKYNIPISHLDFDYVKKCTDVKELEKIYLTLKSGEEGFFPELQQCCEDRLTDLNPNSQILRKENPVSTKGDLDHSEWQDLDKDFKDWSRNMKHMEESVKSSQNVQDTTEDEDLPPIRSGAITLTSEGAKTTKPSTKKAMPREYRDWDRIDIDKEFEKVDTDDKATGRCFVDGKEVKDIPEYIDTKGLTESEKLMKANREKDKGNEAFKSGDYKEAIVYYSRSISLQPTAASYNNRALAYLKTEDWIKALTDTDKVLKLEPENIKALLRQATARKGLKLFDKAKKDLERVLDKEPNNKRAQDLLKEVEKEIKEKKTKGRRMVIEDVDEEENDTEEPGLVNDDKGNEPKSVPKGNNSEKSGSKVNEEKTMMNGHSEPVEFSKKNEREILDNGNARHAGGDTDISRDIWTEEDLSEQILVTTSKKVVNNADTSLNFVEGDIDQSVKHGNENERTKEFAEQEEIKDANSEVSNERENKDDVTSENNIGVSTEQKESSKIAIDKNESDENERDNEESVEETSDVKPLTRPVFYQKPFPDSCLKLREEGNNLFKSGQYGDAISRYSKIIAILENEDDQVVNLSLMYSNRAACQLKTGDLPGAVRDCTRSLQLIPHSVKPLLRRAMAYEHLERPRLAYIDYRHVLLLDNRMDQAHLGTKRCQELLHQKDGPRWREKFQLPSVAWWEIPEIIDVDGKPTSQVVFNTPVPTPQQTGSLAQTDSAKQSSPREVKEKPKELTPGEMFEKSKAEGNDFVKKGLFAEAVTCYNKCMEALPDQVAIYTNRALCYIKLNQPFEAEEDCTHALSVEKGNVKALFRRAQARKMLSKNREGIEDLNQLLKVDPKNTAAKKEMDIMKKLWREELDKIKEDMPISSKEEKSRQPKSKDKSGTKQRKRLVIEEVESDEEAQGDKAAKAKQKSTRPKVEEIGSSCQNRHQPGDSPKQTTASPSKKDPERKASPLQHSSKDSKKSKKSRIKETSTGLPNAQTSVPKLEKATPYEFISAWNALKKSESIQPYYDLLQQIPVKDLSSVISNKLDGPMLNVMIRCAAEYYLPKGEMDGAYQLLKNLSKVQRFGTVSMFMSSEEQSSMRSILEKLASQSSSIYSKDDILKLKKDYSIK